MADGNPVYDEQLPWLEAVDDDDEPRGVSAGKMLAWLVVVLAAAALVGGAFFWLGRQNADGGSGAPELIKAEPGPYKIRPPDPGGLDVAGESETAFATSAGEETEAELDLAAVPEQPVARPAPKAEPAEAKPAEAPAAPEPSAQPTGGSGSVIQLGAYRNAAQAQRAWDALSARFPTLSGMTKLVVPFSGGFRLRAGAASPAEARQACQALRVAGENCFVAN